MKKLFISIMVIFGIVVLVIIFKFPLWVYRTGGGQIDSWSCNGKQIVLQCVGPRGGGITLMPSLCDYLCIGISKNETVNDVLNDLDFYKDGYGLK